MLTSKIITLGFLIIDNFMSLANDRIIAQGPPKTPPGYVGPWGHRRETGEIRRGRWEGPCRRSGRGAEGDCPVHSDLGSLLSSQLISCPPNPPPGLVGPWGHRWEDREVRRGRLEVPSQIGGAGEERRAFAPPARAQESCWAPR